MSILDKIASALGRRDEKPNQDLAKQILAKNDSKGVKELVENLSNKNAAIQSDCIKVLYEIGESKPALIVDYIKNFISLLDHKNNRLQWGAMAAIDAVALENPKLLYAVLPTIMEVADKGSVITRDHAVNVLIKLCTLKQYEEKVFPLLVEQLLTCPVNQLGMYGERALPIINDKNKARIVQALRSRLADLKTEAQQNRIGKIIKKLS